MIDDDFKSEVRELYRTTPAEFINLDATFNLFIGRTKFERKRVS